MGHLRLITCAVLIATAATVAACETYDPGNPLRTRPVTTDDPNEPAADDANPADDDDDGATTTTPPTFVPPAAAPNLGVFEKAPAFAAAAGATTRKAKHNFAGNTPVTNPAGRACMQCHGAAGPAPRFVVGGTIFKDAAGKMPAARVEVRIIDAQNKATSTYTDADGNYFIKFDAAAPVTFPIRAGVRDADSLLSMRAGAAAGNCNSCHKPAGASTPIAVP
jgi:cytochrome c553